jgi:mannose-6-phosphate isomerase-like protein (cupin superfamily)
LIGGEDWYPDWPGVPLSDIATGVLELDPGAYYPLHLHPAPEIYYVIEGRAKWTVGKETFLAKPGTAIYHRPNTPHRMINIGKRKLKVFWIWYAPGGKTDVLDVSSKLIEPMPK